MKTGDYTVGYARCRVGISELVAPELRPKLREISGLVCDAASRGKGHATRVMSQVIAVADDHGMTLLVVPQPFEDEPMDKTTLRGWYARLGFRVIQAQPCVMARPPKVLHA
jgi:N-acetylglutamate synthase-like GNAT family acetyltransferase